MRKYILLLLSVFLICQTAPAQRQSKPGPGSTGDWKFLGTVQARHTSDHDAFFIRGPYDYFRKLKFKVTDAPLYITRMIVRYDDGGLPENIDVRHNIPKGGESRIIDLSGRKRKLKQVDFWFETKGMLNGKADLSLFGIK
jgi:hypothetical protein